MTVEKIFKKSHFFVLLTLFGAIFGSVGYFCSESLGCPSKDAREYSASHFAKVWDNFAYNGATSVRSKIRNRGCGIVLIKGREKRFFYPQFDFNYIGLDKAYLQ